LDKQPPAGVARFYTRNYRISRAAALRMEKHAVHDAIVTEKMPVLIGRREKNGFRFRQNPPLFFPSRYHCISYDLF
jgi:hypothetical protein